MEGAIVAKYERSIVERRITNWTAVAFVQQDFFLAEQNLKAISRGSSGPRRQNAASPFEQHVADPRAFHHVRLHRAARLSDPAGDLLHRPHHFRMVGLAGIAETLREVVRTD